MYDQTEDESLFITCREKGEEEPLESLQHKEIQKRKKSSRDTKHLSSDNNSEKDCHIN